MVHWFWNPAMDHWFRSGVNGHGEGEEQIARRIEGQDCVKHTEKKQSHSLG